MWHLGSVGSSKVVTHSFFFSGAGDKGEARRQGSHRDEPFEIGEFQKKAPSLSLKPKRGSGSRNRMPQVPNEKFKYQETEDIMRLGVGM